MVTGCVFVVKVGRAILGCRNPVFCFFFLDVHVLGDGGEMIFREFAAKMTHVGQKAGHPRKHDRL